MFVPIFQTYFFSFYIMEDKENLVKLNAIQSALTDTSLFQRKSLRPIRRLIRRKNKDMNKQKTRVTQKKKRRVRRNSCEENERVKKYSQVSQLPKEKIHSNIEQQCEEKSRSCSTSIKKSQIQKIEFDIKFLPHQLQLLYKQKQKIKNTWLVISGVKFVKDLSKKPNSINNWKQTLIIYQESYKQNQRCHFGLILKYGDKLITFDGITKLWPLKSVQKSFHWQIQSDTWSCGYRVLFWVKKIRQIGIQKWVQEFQSQPNDQEIQIDC